MPMATIIGAIAASHTPTIGFALDHDKESDPAWRPIFEAFAPVRAWLDETKPDVLLMIYNDHISSFFLDHYSPFALGVGRSYEPADEGGGPRDLPPMEGDSDLAQHVGRSLAAEEFDLSFFQDRALDHGCFSPLSMIYRGGSRWPVRIVPLQVGVLQLPAPSPRRCWKLGAALRRAIESYPQDIRVAIVGTGGLSHQVHGERAGFNNEAWDAQFLDLIENDPERLAQLTLAELATLGGMEGAEVVMWLVMRGALSANVRKVHQSYYLPSMTGIATAVYENMASRPIAGEVARQRQLMDEQLRGIDALPGTYPYTLERSVKAHRINRFLHQLTKPDFRARFRSDEAGMLPLSDLSAEEQSLIARRDWRGLIHYGVIFFLLEKLGAVDGVSNLHIYAAMRGQSLAEFQSTRKAPGAIYSVAGRDRASR
jgi:gallate dioxygenase